MLKVVFLGGGSLRLVPIIRSLFKNGQSLNGGCISLCDLNVERAEAVGRLIQRCPEFSQAECSVEWTANLDEALEGADVLYVTMAIERQPSLALSKAASAKYGFLHSDQLSLTGGFLAARGGPVILNFAKKMEKICPDALMLIFANPVGVYSAMVNNYTKIKALGVCQGFGNHRWDIPRLLGRDEYDDSINVVAAGINHLSFILRGKWHEENLFDILDKHLVDGWEPCQIENHPYAKNVRIGLQRIYELYRRFGTTIFSSEGDGMAHIYWDEEIAGQKNSFEPLSPKQLKDCIASETVRIEKKFKDFAKQANGNDDSIWYAPENTRENKLFGVNFKDIANPILNAINGDGKFTITASANNAGAVDGFDPRAALEYTMNIDGKSIVPIENQYVPEPFHGLISSLAEHQTLIGEAIANEEPKCFANALEAYPKGAFTKQRHEYLEEMFNIFSDIPEYLSQAQNYLNWKHYIVSHP